MIHHARILPVALALVLSFSFTSVRAQTLPWVVFEDALSDSVCDVVNAANAELVVLESTGELVTVSGVDLILVDTFVDFDGFVFYRGFPAGFIDFAEDADGYSTLWWMSLTGYVMDLDSFTLEPFDTDLFPSDIGNVPCDACDFWDDPSDCDLSFFDADLDGVLDVDDLCSFTPLSEIADLYGCSCSQLDDDVDGVDNCYDLCPGTFPLAFADLDGCSCDQLDDDLDGVDNCDDLCPFTLLDRLVDIDGCPLSDVPPVTINFCGSTGATTLAMTLCGLVGLGLMRRRWI